MSGKIQKYKRLNPLHPVINCKIYLDDYSLDVSSPDETLFEAANSKFKVEGRLLKVSLLNNMFKSLLKTLFLLIVSIKKNIKIDSILKMMIQNITTI